MMCAQRLQRVLMAIMLTISLYFLSIGSTIGLVLQLFIIVMLLIWAFTDICPALTVLEKIFGNCEDKKEAEAKKEDNE